MSHPAGPPHPHPPIGTPPPRVFQKPFLLNIWSLCGSQWGHFGHGVPNTAHSLREARQPSQSQKIRRESGVGSRPYLHPWAPPTLLPPVPPPAPSRPVPDPSLPLIWLI